MKPLLPLAVLLAVGIAGCSKSDPAENTDTSTRSPELSPGEKAEATLEQVMATIAKDHPESEVWKRDPIFTLGFQDRVEELDGKMAITFAKVLDVYRAGNEYRMLCDDGSPGTFLLRCSAEQAQHIVEMSKLDSTIYGVVFRVTKLSVTLDRLREAQIDDDEPYISEGDLQPRFYLIGDCVALYDASGMHLVYWWDYVLDLQALEGDEG